MAMTNPYNLRTMIPIDSDMFFGREKEMRRIEGMLSGNTPQCVSIVGERRIGKSSLAFRVFHKMKEAENTIAVFMDCDGLSEECKTKDQFLQLLDQKFLEDNPQIKELLGKKEEKLFDNYSSFKSFIKETGRKKMNSIIFIDEFEHLPANQFADDTFFSNLRAMANNPNNRLAFVTISKTRLKELTHQSIKSSGFWNIFNTETIGLLNHKSIEKLRKYGFDKTDFAITEEEIEKIHYYAGDFPFFNQVVCAFIWDSKVDKEELNWDKLEIALIDHYKKLWEDRTKEEQKLLIKLLNINFSDDFALKEMQNRGLVISDDSLYIPFSDYFSRLIEKDFKVKRKKITLKAIIQYIKEALGIIEKGKKIATGKDD
jgi:AAA+ ATPase superfamily predicted ATPase